MSGQLKKIRINAGIVRKLAILLMIGVNTLAAGVHAGDVSSRDTVYFTLPPSPEVLASHLFGGEPERPLTRSISFKKPTSDERVVENRRSVTMPVLFHFGKTTITRESRPFLDNVGEMLVSPSYADRALIVEGHTDAIGSAEFNQGLSELRALAIRDYLVNNFAIDPARLLPVGRGESLLYNKINPKAGENRRVEFMPHVKS